MQAAFPARDSRALPLFDGLPWARGMILAAFHGMGRIWTDAPLHPRCAVAAAGDFLLCGGIPGPSAAHLLRRAVRSEKREWLICARGAWREIAREALTVEETTRWAFDHHVQPEDERLRELLAARPEGTVFQPIEGDWIPWCRQQAWSRDFVSLYTDEQYERQGLGVLLMLDGVPVAGASSYATYPGGVEMQLQTRDDRQGRGYAVLAAAQMILSAHRRGLAVTWDAANEASAHIARKLGYHPMGDYTAFVCRNV